MSEHYNIVPWNNSNEWLEVYTNIYVEQYRKKALEQLLIWKARSPSLPSGIESTLTFLEVLIQDECDNATNDQLLRLAYSSAIMRFVNHMLDTETVKGTSLYQAARNLGVPDWIIDLRHDTAHSNRLPSIELLREAAQIGIEWLEKNYWIKYKQCIKDYITKKDVVSTENNKIAGLMQFCTSLSFCAHAKCKIKNLSEIPDDQLKESIVNDARDLFGEQYDFSNLKTVSVKSLINILHSQSKKLLKNKDAAQLANAALLGEGSLFLSLEVLNAVDDCDFLNEKKLSGRYVQSFEVLLTFLHTTDLLLNFTMGLIEITQHSERDNTKCLLAALWVSEILRAWKKLQNFTNRMKRSHSMDIKSKNNHELRSLYHHWFPNDTANGFLLDMQKPVPPELADIQFIQPIISSYNPYLKYFIRDLLNLLDPKLPDHVTKNICELAELISCPDSFPAMSSKIYTIDDLNGHLHDSVQQKSVDDKTTHMDVSVETEINGCEESEMSHCWKMSSRKYNWAACPIGLLPWQINL